MVLGRTNSPVVFHKGPKLFQSVKLTTFKIFQRFCLEVSVEVGSEFLFQSVAEESEQALKTIPEQVKDSVKAFKNVSHC